VDVFWHEAGRPQLGAPTPHRLPDKDASHASLHLAGPHRLEIRLMKSIPGLERVQCDS